MTESISARLHEAIAIHAAAGRQAFSGAEPMTYADLGRLVGSYAAGVRDWGVARGETVGIVAPKTVAAIAAYFGAMQAGACVCFIDPGLAIERIAEQADVVGMRRLVVDETLIDRFYRRAARSRRCAHCGRWTRAAPSSTAGSGAGTARCCSSHRAAPAAPRVCCCDMAA